MKKYFGTDGIRGEFQVDLTLLLAYKVGRALKVLNRKDVIIAYDTRESNIELFNAIKSGAKKEGLNIYNLGVLTTPGLYFSTLNSNVIGVMITASHNPYTDNGIKIFLDGAKLCDQVEEVLENEIDKFDDTLEIENDSCEVLVDKRANYVKFLESVFNEKLDLRVGFDAANGSTSSFINEVFSKVVKDVFVINNTPNGKNINLNCGATHTNVISKFCVDNKLDLGFSFDGDGDRMLMCDSKGTIYTGDQIVYTIGKYLGSKNELVDNSVVLTIMSNVGILNSLKKNNLNYVLTQVGDKYVLEEMIKNNYVLGGEDSGHTIISNYLKTGDGMLTALMIIKILHETKQSIEEITSDLVIYPSSLRNITVKDKKVAKDNKVLSKVKEINEALGEYGGCNVRASGTENYIRLYCCCRLESDVENYLNELEELVLSL